MKTTTAEIAGVNLIFRSTLMQTKKHRVVLSEEVAYMCEHDPEGFQALITAVRGFKNFDQDNDPHGERDFGRITLDGQDFFFKIDLYDSDKFEYGFDRETMPHSQCHRVLTLMRASEY